MLMHESFLMQVAQVPVAAAIHPVKKRSLSPVTGRLGARVEVCFSPAEGVWGWQRQAPSQEEAPTPSRN